MLMSMAEPLWEFTQVTWVNVGQHHVAANSYAKLQTWPVNPVGCYRPNIHPSPSVLLLNDEVGTLKVKSKSP